MARSLTRTGRTWRLIESHHLTSGGALGGLLSGPPAPRRLRRRGRFGFLGEQVADPAAEPRHDVLARELVVGPQPAYRLIAAEDLNRAEDGMDDPDQLDSRSQVFLDLLIELIDAIMGRNHLNGQIRRDCH